MADLLLPYRGAQLELCAHLGTSQAVVSSWYTGRSRPTPEQAIRIIRWLSARKLPPISLQELLGVDLSGIPVTPADVRAAA